MPNFVYDDTALFFPKTNLNPIPGGGDSTKYVADIDWNTLNQAVEDVKGVLRGAEWYGLSPQATDPAPSGVDDYLWFDTSDQLFLHVGGGGGSDINITTGGSGEVNTASNVNVGGVGVFKQKSGVDLEFKGLNAGSSKVSIVDEVGNNEIDIDVVEANVVHNNLSGSGTHTHAQIDTHIGLLETVAQGSVWFSDGSAVSALVPGTAGQFLKTQGAAADAVWGDSTLTIQDEGSPVTNTPHTTINFAGSGVSVADGGSGVSTVTIPGASGTSLQGAYDFGSAGGGRTITAHDGAVVIQTTEVDGTNVLEINKTPTGFDSGDGLFIAMGANAGGAGLSISHASTDNEARAISVTSGLIYVDSGVEITANNVDPNDTATGALYVHGNYTGVDIDSFFHVAFELDTIQYTTGGGTIAEQAGYYFDTTDYSADTDVVTITDCATWRIAGVPTEGTNVTITNPWALWSSGAIRVDGSIAQTGATSGKLTQSVPAVVTDHTLTWPAAVAATTGYVLSSTDAGILSWAAAAGGATTLDEAYDGGTSITVDAGAVTTVIDSVGVVTTDGVTALLLQNTTVSTVGSPQWSPVLVFEGTSWDSAEGGGSENEITKFGLQLQTVSAGGGGGGAHFMFSVDAAAYSSAGDISNTGVWSSVGDIVVGEDLLPSGSTNDVGSGGSLFRNINAHTSLTVTQEVKDGVFMTPILNLNSNTHTDLSDGNAIYIDFDIDSFINFASVSTDQTAVRILAPTFTSDTGSQTIVNATTVYISAAPAVSGGNVVITNPRALWVDAGDVLFDDGLSVGGAFEHAGSTFGVLGTTAVAQQTSGADLTNNVTSGGTTDQVDNWTDLSTYATDAAAIRNAIYQLSRKLKQVNDAARLFGFLT